MSAPLMLWCPNVSANYDECQIADEFWTQEIAWVSMVSIVKTADPATNCVYIQISGWKGDIAYEIHYWKFGAINTPIGWFCATDIVLHGNVEKVDFPISYYLRPPVRYIGEPQLAPLNPVPCETSPDCNHMYCYKVDAEELTAIQKFHDELADNWDHIQSVNAFQTWKVEFAKQVEELKEREKQRTPETDDWNQLQQEQVEEETDELREKRLKAYAGVFIETGYKVTSEDHLAWHRKKEDLEEEARLEKEAEEFLDDAWNSRGARYYGYTVYDEF